MSYIVFIDGMDGDGYASQSAMLDAVKHAFDTGAEEIIIKKQTVWEEPDKSDKTR